MSKGLSVIALCVALAGPAIAHAAVNRNDVAVSLGLGTEGVGAQVSAQIVPHTLALNVGFSRFSHDFNFTADAAHFNANLRLGAVPVVLSWYPFHGNFSIDAGVFINQNRVAATGVPEAGGTYTINGDAYTASQVGTMSGTTHFHTAAPYVGIGWGDPFAGGRWSVLVNAGAMYEGSPNVDLHATGAATNPRLASDVAALQNSVNHKLNFLNWWPVVTIGVAYRF